MPNILLTLAFFDHKTDGSLCLERDTQAAKSHLNCPEMSLILTIFQTQISMVNNFLRNSYNAESVQRMLISKALYTGHNEGRKKVHNFQ